MTAAAPPVVTPARRLLLMTSLLLSTVLASLDSSFVPLAFPDMIDKLDTSTAVVVWVALGYLIFATGPMLLSARLAEALGLARVFQLGTAVYSVSMIACTYAPDVGTLIAIRIVQGIGMALFLPTTFAIASQIYPPDQRARALGIMQTGNAFGFILGPIFAGWLLDAYDWRAIFGSRIPFAAVAILLSVVAFGPRLAFRTPATGKRWDLKGALFLTLAIFGLLFGTNRLPVEDNHLDWSVWAVFAAGFVFLWLFVRHERRVRDPLIDLDIFRSAPFTRAAIAFSALFASFPVYLFILPIVLRNGLEMRAWDIGMTLAVVALVTAVVSPSVGRMADRFGPDKLCTAGVIMTGLGYLSFLYMQPTHGPLELIPGMVLLGLGSGLFFSPNNALLMSNVEPRHLGLAASLIGVLRQSGYALGFALIASLFTAVQDRVEESWSFASLDHIPKHSATELSSMFEEGGIWSPEVLLFVLKLAALIGTGILVVSLVNSLPRLVLPARRQAAVAGGALAVTLAAVALYGTFSAVRFNPVDTAAARGLAPPQLEVAPFGMAARPAVDSRPREMMAGAGPAYGEQVYTTNCSACHGPDRRGLPNLGVDLVGSKFVAGRSPAELVEFLRAGRMPGQPGNVTGRVMPAFGYLAPQDLEAVAAFVRGGG